MKEIFISGNSPRPSCSYSNPGLGAEGSTKSSESQSFLSGSTVALERGKRLFIGKTYVAIRFYNTDRLSSLSLLMKA